MSYLDCWTSVAMALFSQALAGEPELSECAPRPVGTGAFGFTATLSGDQEGCFSVILDPAILDAPLMGEGMDQKTGWGELLREVAGAAAGELLARDGKKCCVERFEPLEGENQGSRCFQLTSAGGVWTILVRDELSAAKIAGATPEAPATQKPPPPAGINQGIELLLDVELEAALRFGCREMPLGEILDLGPGDVVELDRHVTDPVDLIVGDKIVARGEVVLVYGNFGLRIVQVAAPHKRLESIRCLF